MKEIRKARKATARQRKPPRRPIPPVMREVDHPPPEVIRRLYDEAMGKNVGHNSVPGMEGPVTR